MAAQRRQHRQHSQEPTPGRQGMRARGTDGPSPKLPFMLLLSLRPNADMGLTAQYMLASQGSANLVGLPSSSGGAK